VLTGNVPADFPVGPGVQVVSDSVSDVYFVASSNDLRPTGWDIHDVRFAYDRVTDTAYFGAWCWEVLALSVDTGSRLVLGVQAVVVCRSCVPCVPLAVCCVLFVLGAAWGKLVVAYVELDVSVDCGV
jgi:hypothetical protein